MTSGDLVLYEEEYRRIHDALARLRKDANALSVFLLARDGQPIASAGDVEEIDATALASLTAGNVAATEGLAELAGEKEFRSLYHEGSRRNIHITLVGGRTILVVVFDERSSLGLVRLRVRKTGAELASVIGSGQEKQGDAALGGLDSVFAEITDEDIDNLFAD